MQSGDAVASPSHSPQRRDLNLLKATVPPEIDAIIKSGNPSLAPTTEPTPVTIDGNPYTYTIIPANNKSRCNTISVMPMGADRPTFQMTTCG
jgi:hypothetical protein